MSETGSIKMSIDNALTKLGVTCNNGLADSPAYRWQEITTGLGKELRKMLP